MDEPAVVTDRPVRIQIVEDERIVALDLRTGLEQLGYEVVGIASDEPEALRLARHTEPDLVLMDIHLDRGSDGISAARKLRELLAVPVIFLSAYGEPETLQRAAEAAPYGYLLKPFELRELNATVRMAMVRRAEERKTEVAERRLRLALESARLAVLELDTSPSGHRLRWVGQEAVPELRSLTQAQSLVELSDGLEPRGQDALQTLVQLGTPMDLTCAWQADGEPSRWLEIHARHFEPEGVIIGMVRDVSERVERENHLRQAAVAFDATDEAILFLDGEQRVLSCNSAFAQLTGWVALDVIGHRPEEFLFARRQGDPTRDPEAHHWHGEVTCRRRDGSSFPALQHFAAVLNDDGQASHHVLSFADISEIRQAQHALRHQALHDALTGLGNRVLLQQALQTVTGPMALVFMDLDGFKTINDTLGHDAGDALLKQVATRIRALLRKDDVAVRLGGDEFVMLLQHVDHDEAALHVTHKLLAAVAQPLMLEVPDSSPPQVQSVLMTASIGVALYPSQVDSPQTLLRAADAAMYQAKARGRCRSVLFESAMADVASHRLQLEQGLRVALELGQFRLAWQPVVDLRTADIVGAEVLLRWRHPELGDVPPSRFIPVAEDMGLITRIGAWVLDEAVAQAAAWRGQGLVDLRVAVNVSVRQFEQDDVPALVAQTLMRHGFPAHLLELELTESLIAQAATTELALLRLRQLGVRLALDDFGTGFSSLAQLTALPMDRLKIDRSFINALAQEGSAHAVVRSIVALASGLNLSITAEGVETLGQQEWLLSLAEMDAQGYLFHKPIPADALAMLLSR
ncbi:PAS domain S-box-containing protein/diguanylate cyclase (GGDEF) domain-containing protein [Roseateles sp. YR242]|uniref:two-component system response regulator n=1 Tax=Roseateles sp. YR242 TaxID=1855305 RepID=UPI0008AE7B42|nr:EAL domain-containing protein [Roseateles sp. YR242]SEK76722.1 PAS domain S-box-containing protein/diguanylate cyclase (GGDEF) domain-containing protein [Roseateles sp. YR242]